MSYLSPAGYVGVSYLDCPGTNSVYSLTSGSLPPGLALDATSGCISGVPGEAGVFPFSINNMSLSITVTCPTTSLATPPSFSGTAIPVNTELYVRKFINDMGTVPTDKYYTKVTKTFIITGTNPTAVIDSTPSTNYPVFVFINGVLQKLTDGYTVASLTYTLIGTFSNDVAKIVYWK